MNVTVALVQYAIAHLEPKTNIERAEYFIQKASKEHANVVVFPEDFITASIFGNQENLNHGDEYRRTFQRFLGSTTKIIPIFLKNHS
ncbi:MAG TPA: hypothetical protein DCY48_04195 [Candidatus Magasanikbacteria bacterium]|nr:MAG: hypothetical protein A3I74_00250 [Candidatus Magasanikbacteria bacterium RIFCSPLOWO2_02_FULL_47_16]OGH80115.1 MAG: hypothetical protein A3C10_02980 [Candidatus Magasanikbacteria bacterium RIFCSPHIGHO2_02_FULL_48_18]OGH83194.1 MAG: hypothetical protein A3G08_02695 [Candidatus Magasanikbacteria bacterium RIFCSPLOWO2_12_FULL_47_9b]HAZ28945.1 hypothetical protein [Candidatus Magasanikbacteria bacterium]